MAFFQSAFEKWLRRAHALAGRCVTPSLLPAVCASGVAQVTPSHRHSSLGPPPAPMGLCPPTDCVRVIVVCFVRPPPTLWIPPPHVCIATCVVGLLVANFWVGGLVVGRLVQNAKGGGGDSPTLRGCSCGVCVGPLTPRAHPQHIMLCVVVCIWLCSATHTYANVCVLGAGGGGHICVCMRQVCWLL